MLLIQIPGRDELTIEHLVLDFNGTIAFDGQVIEGVKERLETLAKQVKIHVITADTNGSVHQECKDLPLDIHVIDKNDQLGEKKRFIEHLQPSGTISIGNGSNDESMFEASDLAIAVLGGEGIAVSSLLKSDIVVQHIHDALDLIMKQHRLVATLRK